MVLTEELENLARKIAGQATNAVALEHARAAAEAELELAQVRRARLALIERMSSLGGLEAPRHFKTSMEECRWLIAMEKWLDTRSI